MYLVSLYVAIFVWGFFNFLNKCALWVVSWFLKHMEMLNTRQYCVLYSSKTMLTKMKS